MESSSGPRTAVCVLVAVDSFDHPESFRPIGGDKARNNIARLAEVLVPEGDGDRFASRVLGAVNPERPDDVRELLRPLEEEPPDLLVFYYMGHGYLDPNDTVERDKFYLTVRASSPRDISHTALSFRDLAAALHHVGAERTVVVLDCCFSGNFPLDALPTDRCFSVLTSSRRNFLISPGPPGEPLTPFTRGLVTALRQGPCTVGELGIRLRELSRETDNRPASPYMPWHPTEISVDNGAGTVLPPGPAGPQGGGRGEEPEQDEQGDERQDEQGDEDHSFRHRPLRTLRGAAGRWRPVLVALLLVTATGVGGRVLLDDAVASCPPPLEMRMATAPEEVDSLRELVRAFEDSSSNHRSVSGADDCRTVRFTVYGTSLDALTDAFGDAGRWGRGAPLTEVGPQPDVWAAQSSAAVSHVRTRLVPPPGQHGDSFFRPAPLMVDRPVLVLTDTARTALDLPEARGEPRRLRWRDLRARLTEPPGRLRPELLRPNPTVSGVGLVHTLGLYAAEGAGVFDGGSGLLPAAEVHRLEADVIDRGRSIARSAQALCALAGPGGPAEAGREGEQAASGALVSGRQAALYVERPARYCAGDAEPDVHRYVLEGGPPMDYQLVRVLWPADDRAERTRAADAFRRWTRSAEGARAVRSLGFAPHGRDGFSFRLSDRDVADRLALFHAAHPELRLHVVFDTSGSMRENGRFQAARAAVEEALRRLGEGDRYRLVAFPTRDDGTGLEEVTDGWRAVPDGGGADLPLSADDLRPRDVRQADLYAALREATEGLGTRLGDDRQHAVLVVTDGHFLRGRPLRTDRLADLAERLRLLDVPVLVASMRPYRCAPERDTGILAEHSGGECAPLSGTLAADLSRHVAALGEGRPS